MSSQRRRGHGTFGLAVCGVCVRVLSTIGKLVDTRSRTHNNVQVNGTAFISDGSVAQVVLLAPTDDSTLRVVLINATGEVVGAFSDVQVQQRGGKSCSTYNVQSQDNNGAARSGR